MSESFRESVESCQWCNEPINELSRATAKRIGGALVHCDPAHRCVLELAHDIDDVELCYSAAIEVIELLAAQPLGAPDREQHREQHREHASVNPSGSAATSMRVFSSGASPFGSCSD